MSIAEALARLRATPEFQAVIEAAQEKRPFLLPYDIKKSMEENAAKQAYCSGQINGFELVFNFLKGSK